MTDKPTEPTTEAGRALLAYVDRVSVDGPMPVTAEDILAIEGQARQQLERDVLALREALRREMDFGCHCGTSPCRNVALLTDSAPTAQAIEDGVLPSRALSTPDPSPVACWHDAMDIQCDCPSPSTDAVADPGMYGEELDGYNMTPHDAFGSTDAVAEGHFSERLGALEAAVNSTISDGPTMDTLSSEKGWFGRDGVDPKQERVYIAIHELSDALAALRSTDAVAEGEK